MIIDVHVHSNHSDGFHSPRAIAKHVKKIGLDGFALVDHNTTSGIKEAKTAARELGLEFIPGIEISTRSGHVIGLFIDKLIHERDIERDVEKIKDLGGIAIAPHPYDIVRFGIGDFCFKLDFDYIESFNSRSLTPFANKKADAIARGHKIPRIVGSDAHYLSEIGAATIKIHELKDLHKGRLEINDTRKTHLVTLAGEIFTNGMQAPFVNELRNL